MSKNHILIIGAGLVGAATAYALVQRGFAVTLVDRGATPAVGASHANGGMLTPSMADPWNAPGVWRDLLRWVGREDAPMLLRLSALPGLTAWGAAFLANSRQTAYTRATRHNVELGLFSLRVMAEWRERMRPQYAASRCGTLKIYRSEAAWYAGIAKAASFAVMGVRYDPWDCEKLVQNQPSLAPIASRLAGAVHFPDDESGDAAQFTRALVDGAADRGAQLLFGRAVQRLWVEGGKVRGAILDDGQRLDADAVVLAAGAETPSLARSAGVKVAVAPVKGYSLTYAADGIALPTLPLVDDALHAALTPLGSRLRVAGTAEFSGFDARIVPARIANLKYLLRQILPEQADALDARDPVAWAGFRPMHARGVPCIGQTDCPGLYLNCGHGHLGWTEAAGSGEALARLMAGENSDFDLRPFAPD